MVKPNKPPSGGARLIQSGRKPLIVGLKPEDHELIRRAADIERIHMTQLVVRSAIAAAKKIISKSS